MNNEEVKTETQSSNQNFEQQSMIDNQKLTRIVKTIITLENNNVKTRELNDEDMKKKIEKIIEERNKMLLKKLTLTNFRPFKGEHVIEFSTDKEKNITLVMAENGVGETTLAQAFQWVLYSKTDGFKNESVLNSVIEKEMMGGTEQNVFAKLELEHNDVDYIIIRKQTYKKDTSGNVKPENLVLEIYQKQPDGQTVIVNPIKNLSTIANILPESLSKYFFFDGERLEKMAGEVNSGKSEEFKTAVQNILGLTALTKAIEHLNPNVKNSVIGK